MVLAVAYVLFKRKYYHLNDVYSTPLKNKKYDTDRKTAYQ